MLAVCGFELLEIKKIRQRLRIQSTSGEAITDMLREDYAKPKEIVAGYLELASEENKK